MTDGGILIGSGTGDITALGVAANGEIPIGDGTTDPQLATLTAGDNIQITNAAASITIAATGADSSFTGVRLDSIYNLTNVTTTQIIVTDSIRFQDHIVMTTSDLDTLVIALDGVSATNSFTAGTRFFLYMDGATETFSIDTTGTILVGTWEGTTVAVNQGGTGATALDDIIGGTAITVTAGANTIIGGNATVAVTAGGIGTTEIGTDGVSADELNATGVEAELEAVLDLPELQGLLISTQVDSVGGNGIVTHTQLAEYDTIMVELSAGAWDTTSSTGKATSLGFNEVVGFAEGFWSFATITADTLIATFDLPDFFSSFVRIQVVLETEDTTADTMFLAAEGFADDESHALDVSLATSGAATFHFNTVTTNNDLNIAEDFSISGTYSASDHIHFLLRRASTDEGVIRFLGMKIYILRTL